MINCVRDWQAHTCIGAATENWAMPCAFGIEHSTQQLSTAILLQSFTSSPNICLLPGLGRAHARLCPKGSTRLVRITQMLRCAGPAGAHVLVLGAGTGVLALSAAAAGAGRVTAVERSRMLYRMARAMLDANRAAAGAANVYLISRRLKAVGIAGDSHDRTARHPARCVW